MVKSSITRISTLILVLFILSSLGLGGELVVSDLIKVNYTPTPFLTKSKIYPIVEINYTLINGSFKVITINRTPLPFVVKFEEPKMMVDPEQFEDTIYQGSYTTFTIVIEEISGKAPLKDIKIFYPAFYYVDLEGKKRMIPKEWIKFDKEYIEEIPAGGSAIVTCTIEVPKDAKPGTYVGEIGIDVGNIPSIKLLNKRAEIRIIALEPDKTITVKIHVMDSIPPEIVIYSPKDGEVVHEQYITVEGVVIDNIGVKRIKINGEIVSPLILPTIGIEREEVEVEFKKEVQLKEGWNEIEIEAEDYAGNIAHKTIWVKYEIPIPKPQMIVHPKEFEDTIYQGSSTKFTIVIEEISGEAPLKNVRIFYYAPVIYIINQGIDERKIPKEWIKFDKEYIEEIPAGSRATVTCTIEVPKDAEPGVYVGHIGINAGNYGKIGEIDVAPDKFVSLRIVVKEDQIPPEIIVYTPKDGEILSKPYVTLEAVVRDNIGIKAVSVKVNDEEEIPPKIMPVGVGIERERKTEVKIEKEIQLREGWNEIEIEAEDYAGNVAHELIRVKYVPIIIITPTPTPIITIPPPIPTPPITPPPVSPLEYLDVEIHPKYCEAGPGEVVNYAITLDWSPREWRGKVKAKVVLEAAGFKKEWDLPSVEVNQDPPITVNIPVKIPNIPPLTYKLKLIVEAEGLRDEDYTELKVKALGIPGFELILATLALASAFILRKYINK